VGRGYLTNHHHADTRSAELGRGEGFEDIHTRRNPRAGLSNFNKNASLRRRRLDRDLAAARHGLRAVLVKIKDNLF
jgi:hypothetical protein